MSQNKSSSKISESDLKRNNIDVKSENRKMVRKLYLYQILAVIINLMFYMTLSMLVNNFATKEIGKEHVEKLPNGETSVISTILYENTTTEVTATTESTATETTGSAESGAESTATETTTTGTTLPSNQYITPIRTEMSKTVRVISDIFFQLVMVIVIVALIYSPLWGMGDKDSNRIKFSRIKKDKLRGFKIGLWAAIPTFIINFVLILAKIGIVPNYVVFYRLLNTAFIPLTNAFTGIGINDISAISVIELIVLLLTSVVVPIAAHIGYTFGINHISLSEKFVYVNPNKKKKPRRY